MINKIFKLFLIFLIFTINTYAEESKDEDKVLEINESKAVEWSCSSCNSFILSFPQVNHIVFKKSKISLNKLDADKISKDDPKHQFIGGDTLANIKSIVFNEGTFSHNKNTNQVLWVDNFIDILITKKHNFHVEKVKSTNTSFINLTIEDSTFKARVIEGLNALSVINTKKANTKKDFTIGVFQQKYIDKTTEEDFGIIGSSTIEKMSFVNSNADIGGNISKDIKTFTLDNSDFYFTRKGDINNIQSLVLKNHSLMASFVSYNASILEEGKEKSKSYIAPNYNQVVNASMKISSNNEGNLLDMDSSYLNWKNIDVNLKAKQYINLVDSILVVNNLKLNAIEDNAEQSSINLSESNLTVGNFEVDNTKLSIKASNNKVLNNNTYDYFYSYKKLSNKDVKANTAFEYYGMHIEDINKYNFNIINELKAKEGKYLQTMYFDNINANINKIIIGDLPLTFEGENNNIYIKNLEVNNSAINLVGSGENNKLDIENIICMAEGTEGECSNMSLDNFNDLTVHSFSKLNKENNQLNISKSNIDIAKLENHFKKIIIKNDSHVHLPMGTLKELDIDNSSIKLQSGMILEDLIVRNSNINNTSTISIQYDEVDSKAIKIKNAFNIEGKTKINFSIKNLDNKKLADNNNSIDIINYKVNTIQDADLSLESDISHFFNYAIVHNNNTLSIKANRTTQYKDYLANSTTSLANKLADTIDAYINNSYDLEDFNYELLNYLDSSNTPKILEENLNSLIDNVSLNMVDAVNNLQYLNLHQIHENMFDYYGNNDIPIFLNIMYLNKETTNLYNSKTKVFGKNFLMSTLLSMKGIYLQGSYGINNFKYNSGNKYINLGLFHFLSTGAQYRGNNWVVGVNTGGVFSFRDKNVNYFNTKPGYKNLFVEGNIAYSFETSWFNVMYSLNGGYSYDSLNKHTYKIQQAPVDVNDMKQRKYFSEGSMQISLIEEKGRKNNIKFNMTLFQSIKGEYYLGNNNNYQLIFGKNAILKFNGKTKAIISNTAIKLGVELNHNYYLGMNILYGHDFINKENNLSVGIQQRFVL